MTIQFVLAVAMLLGLVLFLFQQVRRPNRTRSLWPKRIRIGLTAVVLLLAGIVFYGFLSNRTASLCDRRRFRYSNGRRN